jgi:MFS family permease
MTDAALEMEDAQTAPSLPWSGFAPILAIHFLGTLGFSLAIPFLVFIVTDLGGAAWTYGLIGATYSTCQLFGAPVLGRWSDRTGRRPVLVASQVGTLIAWIIFLVALSVPTGPSFAFAGAAISLPLVLLFVARALDGATGGNTSVANAYVADMTRETPELRSTAFGRMGMASNFGFVIGPAAAGVLGGTVWGPRLPIAVAAVFAAVTTIAIVLWLREPGGRCPEGPPPPDLAEASLNQQAKPCYKAPPPRPSMDILRDKPVALVLIATFVMYVGFNFFYVGFPVHALQVFKWDTGQLGLYFAALSGLMVVAQGPGLQVAQRLLPGRALFAVGMLCLALALASLLLPPGNLTYLGTAFFALGNGLAWPTFQARVSEVAGEHQGSVQGAATSAGSLASIGGLIVGGFLYPVLGGGLFIAGASLFVVVALLTPVWFPREVEAR